MDLEMRVADLEDELAGVNKRNGELETLFTAARAAPSPRDPKKSLLDELNEFLFGK